VRRHITTGTRRQTTARENAEVRKRLESLERRHAARETEAHRERRRAFVDDAIETGRWPSEKRAALEQAFDSDPAAVAAIVNEIRPDSRRVVAPPWDEGAERSYRNAAADRLGLDADSIV
jgi:hypothetical protein